MITATEARDISNTHGEGLSGDDFDLILNEVDCFIRSAAKSGEFSLLIVINNPDVRAKIISIILAAEFGVKILKEGGIHISWYGVE